jgi:chemotaxis protein histidine kinase CheA
MARPKPSPIKVKAFADHHVITQPNPLRRVIREVDDRDGDDPIARAEQALAGLSGEFNNWMEAECERLAAAHATMIKLGVNKKTRDELFHAAHDIKGDAATFGFPSAGTAAESLCRIIEHAPNLAKVPAALIANHIKAIQAIVREHDQINKSGVERELSRKLRAVADEYLTLINYDRPDHLEAILAPSIVPSS